MPSRSASCVRRQLELRRSTVELVNSPVSSQFCSHATMATTNRRRRSVAIASAVLVAGISVAGASSSECSTPFSSLGETISPPHFCHATSAPSRVGRRVGPRVNFPLRLFTVRGGGGDDDTKEVDEESSGDGGDDEEEEEEEAWREDLPKSPYDYISPSALDSYGGSPQIQNARQAAVGRYGGTIVVAAVATGLRNEDDKGGNDKGGDENNRASVICCSLQRVRKGLRSSRLGSNDGGGGGRTVHVVSCDDFVPGIATDVETSSADDINGEYGTGSTNSVVALAASGLKPDLNLLLTLMRTRSVEVWDRYDVPPGPADVAESISQAFLSFLGYDRKKEAGDGIGPLKDDTGEDSGGGGRDDGFRMSRPFGLEVLVLGVGWNVGQKAISGQDIHGSSILSVGPSGMVRGPFVAHAVGRGHELANTLLKKTWKIGMDETSVRNLCIDAIRTVVMEEMGLGPNDDDEEEGGSDDTMEWEIVCETLSAPAGSSSNGGGIPSTRHSLAG